MMMKLIHLASSLLLSFTAGVLSSSQIAGPLVFELVGPSNDPATPWGAKLSFITNVTLDDLNTLVSSSVLDSESSLVSFMIDQTEFYAGILKEHFRREHAFECHNPYSQR